MKILFSSLLLLVAFCDPPVYMYDFVQSDSSGAIKKSKDYAYVRRVSKKNANVSVLYHVINTSKQEVKLDYQKQEVIVGNVPFSLVLADNNSSEEQELYYYPREGINKEIMIQPGDTLSVHFIYQAEIPQLTNERYLELGRDTLRVKLESETLKFTSKGVLTGGVKK